jgi:hypothetical protein
MKFILAALLAAMPSFAQLTVVSNGTFSLTSYLGVEPKPEINLDSEQQEKPDFAPPVVYGVTSVYGDQCSYFPFLTLGFGTEAISTCSPPPTLSQFASLAAPRQTSFSADWVANVFQSSNGVLYKFVASLKAESYYLSFCYTPVIVQWTTAPGTYQAPQGKLNGIVLIGVAKDIYGNSLLTTKTFVTFMLPPITLNIPSASVACPAL